MKVANYAIVPSFILPTLNPFFDFFFPVASELVVVRMTIAKRTACRDIFVVVCSTICTCKIRYRPFALCTHLYSALLVFPLPVKGTARGTCTACTHWLDGDGCVGAQQVPLFLLPRRKLTQSAGAGGGNKKERKDSKEKKTLSAVSVGEATSATDLGFFDLS